MQLVPITDPVLMRKAAVVPAEHYGEYLSTFCGNLQALCEQLNGLGLAAPQVGVPVRMCVVKVDGNFIHTVNPVMVSHSSEQITNIEGCLSIPHDVFPVQRYTSVVVQYETPYGETRTIELGGHDAMVAQHEIDHLDGLLIVHRTSKKYRNMWLKKHGFARR